MHWANAVLDRSFIERRNPFLLNALSLLRSIDPP